MKRWVLDITRLGIFCSLFLIVATNSLADEHEEDVEKKTFGVKIEIENGEVKVEQTGDGSLDELPAMIEGKIAEAIKKLSQDENIQVRAKTIVRDGNELIKDLPIQEIMDAIQGGFNAEGNVEIDVEMKESDDGHHRVEIHKSIGGDHDDILSVIKGLKTKAGDVNEWVDESGTKFLFVPDSSGNRPAESTHRLGVAIGGPAGLLIEAVADGSAAKEAGLKSGDVLLTVNGKAVGDVGELIATVNRAGSKGKSVKLRVVRGDRVMQVKAVPQPVREDADDEDEGDDEEDDDDQHGHEHGEHHDHEHGEHHDHEDGEYHDHDGQGVSELHRRLERQGDVARKRIERAMAERGAAAEEWAREAKRKAVEFERQRARMMEMHQGRLQGQQESLEQLRAEMAEMRAMLIELKASLEESR